MDSALLLERVRHARGNLGNQTTGAIEFVIESAPNERRDAVRNAVDAAAVLRWFDRQTISAVLSLSHQAAQGALDELTRHSFTSRHGRSADGTAFTMHEAIRLSWRRKMALERHDDFVRFSQRAAGFFAKSGRASARIEYVYHLLGAGERVGASLLEESVLRGAQHCGFGNSHALSLALRELENTGVLQGRARAWGLVLLARHSIAQTGKYPSIAAVEEIRRLAVQAGDPRAEVEALRISAEVLRASNRIGDAASSLAEACAIAKPEAEAEACDVLWLAVWASCLSDSSQQNAAQRDWREATRAAKGMLATLEALQFKEPDTYEWRLRVATAHRQIAALYVSQMRLNEAVNEFELALRALEQLAESHPGDEETVRQLLLVNQETGDCLVVRDDSAGALVKYGICRSLAEGLILASPNNYAWRTHLAIALRNMGDAFAMQGDLVASRAQLLAAYACFEQLSNEDPQDLESQRQLDALSSRLAGLGIKTLPSRVGDPHEKPRMHDVAGPRTEDARRRGAAFAFAYDTCLETKGEARSAVAALDFKGLRTALLRVTRDSQLAEDLLNDAIATALEKMRRGELAEDVRLDGYIYRVALNLLRNHRRREAPARFDTSDALEELAVDDAQPVAEHDTDKWKKAVTELMANLGPRDREILTRFYLKEEDRMEIERELALTSLQFNRVIFRARARLRELLESRGWGKSDFL